MGLQPAITDLEQLKDRPEVAALLAWNAGRCHRRQVRSQRAHHLAGSHRPARSLSHAEERSAASVQRSRRSHLCRLVSARAALRSRLPSVFHPQQEIPAAESEASGEDANIDSLTPIWPGANFFEREVFDLFGVRFDGHPNLTRIMMPENWEGHPLRKDYPVEGYR